MKQPGASSIFKNTARFALALSFVGLTGFQPAHAGGKSPTPAYDVTLENLTYDIYGGKLSYPKIEIKGANIPKAEIEKILTTDMPSADLLKAMKSFSASSVEIPVANVIFQKDDMKSTASCTGAKMEKIADGKIGKFFYPDCSGQLFRGNEAIVNGSFSVKNGWISDYNFVHIRRLWIDKAGPEDKEAVALFGKTSFDNLAFSLTGPKLDLKGKYGRTVSEGPKIKLPSRTLKEIFGQFSAMADSRIQSDPKATPTLEEIDQFKQTGIIVIELLESLQPGSSKTEGFSLAIKDPKLDVPVTLTIDSAESKGFDQKLTGIAFNGGKVTGKLGSYSWTGFSFAPFMAEAKKLLSLPNEQLEALVKNPDPAGPLTRLLLTIYSSFGTYSLDDLEVKAAGVPIATVQSEPMDIQVKLKNFTLTLSNPFNAIPTTFRLAIENLQMPAVLVALDGKPDSMTLYALLKDLGLDPFNASYILDLSWNKDTKELSLNEYSAGEASLGSYNIKGTIGNFSENMFSWDPYTILAAAAGLLVKDVSVHVEDKGGFEGILKVIALKEGETVEQIKSRVPAALALIPEPFASMASVQKAKKATLDFWENRGKLDITVKAKNSAGLSLADFAAARQNPKSLDDKVDITATATK